MTIDPESQLLLACKLSEPDYFRLVFVPSAYDSLPYGWEYVATPPITRSESD